MLYLYVAIGGALGSIARAGMATAVARFTGPQFPWGTILINILGSFVIGFFGTLTANDSRYAVSADLRAFVMIGICGGFTTFSSFSLQTLDLARDGRTGQALLNIGLSVVLCLTAVYAGFSGAHHVRSIPSRAAAVTPAPGGMGEVAVAVLHTPEDAKTLLDAGTRLLSREGGGRLKALAIRLPPAAAVLPSEEVLTEDRAEAVRAEQENWAARLRDVVDDWQTESQPAGVRTELIDIEGDAATIVAEQGRRSDAIVISRPVPHQGERMRECLHAALFDTGSPVLVVPPGHAGPIGKVVAIAWNDDARSAGAVRDGLALLRHADKVHVLCADHPCGLPAVLAEHGIEADCHEVPEGEGSVGARLLRAAHRFGADLLVMGAFAHGPWREAMFGGVTRYMLAEADMPLFMRH